MEAEKYRCNHCGEIFEIERPSHTSELACPRCYSEDLSEYYACSLEIGPPSWEYRCRQCGVRFRVTPPRGPREAEAIRCPACRSKEAKWLALASAACGTGG